jgi:hypothetical protein
VNAARKFTRKHWGTGKYKKPIWIFRTRTEDGKKACSMPTLNDEKLQEALVRVVSWLGDQQSFDGYIWFLNVHR